MTFQLPLIIKQFLESSEDHFRHEKYELYAWNVRPEILIFDFVDYKAQSDYLKRLAFFTEKPGYTGTIATWEELEDKHSIGPILNNTAIKIINSLLIFTLFIIYTCNVM